MNNVGIRCAQIQDLSRIIEIEFAASMLFPVEVLPEAFRQRREDNEILDAIHASLAWIAEIGVFDRVGFLIAKTFGKSMHIIEMDVIPSHGRQGIGAQLIEFAAERASVLGYREITLTTFQHIPWNAPFYARHKFQIVEAIRQFPHLEEALQNELTRGLKFRIAMLRNAA